MIETIRKRWLQLQDFRSRDYGQKARETNMQFETMLRVLEPYVGEVADKRVLDIGCGRFYPFTLLLHSLGSDVTGIDICYIAPNDPFLRRGWRILRYDGLGVLLEELLYKLCLKDRTYYKALKDAAPFPLTTQGIKFERMGVENLNFPDESFDIVISLEVFEHLPDVQQAVSDLSRVMGKGAVAYISIHLFTAPSGGHHFSWQNPHKVPPWDHLRQRRLPLTAYLNKLRESEYIRLFQERLEILEVVDIDKGQGANLLTPEIRAELSDYSDEELLKQGIAVIARKNNHD